MKGRLRRPEIGLRSRVAISVFGCLLLAVCTAPAAPTRWVKTGANDAAVTRELADCRRQANAAMANEEGINQDIASTLGGNWERGSTLGIESNSLNRQAAGVGRQTLDNCMLAKGFVKTS
jgi:hypothetical protein